MDEKDDDPGLQCYFDVSEAIAKTLDDLQPILEAKYAIGDIAIRDSVAQAMISTGVEIYTEDNPLSVDDEIILISHVKYLIWGAQGFCSKDLEPDEPSDLED